MGCCSQNLCSECSISLKNKEASCIFLVVKSKISSLTKCCMYHHVRTACFSTGQGTVNTATQKQDCLLEVEVNTSELNLTFCYTAILKLHLNYLYSTAMECLNKTVYFHFCMKNVSCVVKSRFTLYYKYTYIVMGTLKVLVVIISDYYSNICILFNIFILQFPKFTRLMKVTISEWAIKGFSYFISTIYTD